MTPGTSIVNNTINYTTQPSTRADGTPIPNATLSIPLENTLDSFKIHRFDCGPDKGVQYYLDDKLMHTNDHNTPKSGGSLQLKLWADGNKYWSGTPSRTDVHMRLKSIIAYYNTSSSLTDDEWHKTCALEKRQCTAVTKIIATEPMEWNAKKGKEGGKERRDFANCAFADKYPPELCPKPGTNPSHTSPPRTKAPPKANAAVRRISPLVDRAKGELLVAFSAVTLALIALVNSLV